MQNSYSQNADCRFEIEGRSIAAPAGQMLAAALLNAGVVRLRSSPRAAAPRGAFCLMGSCQECRIVVDGETALACRTRVRPGMRVEFLPDVD